MLTNNINVEDPRKQNKQSRNSQGLVGQNVVSETGDNVNI